MGTGSGKRHRSVIVGVLVLVLVAGVTVQVVRSRCRWGTFAYMVGIENPRGQEDSRRDAAVLIEGKERVVTTDHHVLDVAISPSASQIVVANGKGAWNDEYAGPKPAGLYIYDLDGSGRRLLTEAGGYGLRWSPDGRTIAFVNEQRSIWTVDVDDGDAREIFRVPKRDFIKAPYLEEIAWSADSERIAFFVNVRGNDSVGNLWSMLADGSEVQDILDVDGHKLAWSPDGKRFAYEGSFKNVPSLMMVDRAGGKPRQVEPFGSSPIWSKDGNQLAYVIGHEGHYAPRILVGDAVGSNPVTVPVPEDARGGTSMEDWASC